MRIGILLHSLNESMGGIGVYTQEIARALLCVDQSNEYVLLYPGFGKAGSRRGQFRRFKNAVEVETAWSRVPLETYWDQVVIPRVATQHALDVVFNPHLTVPIRGRFGKVMVLHNVEYHTVPKVYDARMYSWWFLLENFIMPAADRVISLSQVMTADFRKYVRYPIERVRTIYHGVSDKFHITPDAERLARVREEYALPEKFILFVGNLYPQKNFATLVRAFARIKGDVPHKLIVAGRSRYKFEGDVALVRELGLERRVEFVEFVPNDDLVAVYNLADCFVYPSLYESFGLAQLEAMACGCPVIGANAGAIPEVSGGAALLFNPHDDEELSRAILRVTQDSQLRDDLVRRGLARAREFTWERTARETLDVFKELA